MGLCARAAARPAAVQRLLQRSFGFLSRIEDGIESACAQLSFALVPGLSSVASEGDVRSKSPFDRAEPTFAVDGGKLSHEPTGQAPFCFVCSETKRDRLV